MRLIFDRIDQRVIQALSQSLMSLVIALDLATILQKTAFMKYSKMSVILGILIVRQTTILTTSETTILANLMMKVIRIPGGMPRIVFLTVCSGF